MSPNSRAVLSQIASIEAEMRCIGFWQAEFDMLF
jgi:hypothetical protein